MKLTESQARRAIRKWLFEYTTDSGVSHRASTDDKKAGKLGDDREDQPASTIPQEIPIMPMSQMSAQLTHEMPAVEDADFIPGTIEELGRSADVVAQQIPHSEIQWFYDKIKEIAEEAIDKGNKVNILDEYEPDQKESNPTIRPSQKASQESAAATNEQWNRWSKLLSESWYNKPGKMTQRMKKKKLTRQDMALTRDPDPEWLKDDWEDDDDTYTPPTAPTLRSSSMGGEVVGGEYMPSQEDLEDMGMTLDSDINELPGFDRKRHRTKQEVIQGGEGDEAKLRELVDLKIFPNITTMSGMRKMINNQIDPVVQIWFNANGLSKQMSQFVNSSAGQYMFFDALTCSNLFTDDNVLELKGALKIANALVSIKFKKKSPPKKYKKNLAKSGDFLRSESQKFSSTIDPNTGKSMQALVSDYDSLKEKNRNVLLSTGLYSAVMSNIVVAPILRRWAAEIKAGTIDISSSKNKGQVTWEEAGNWIEEEVKAVWNKMGNGRKGKKVTQAMTAQMEFHDALETARDEAEFRAMELESEGHKVKQGNKANVKEL